MANAKELRADIVIGGRLDNSFTALGSAIESLGQQVNQISQPLIEFGKQSVQEYVKYEDAMLDAEVALSTQITSTSELERAMEKLNTSALEWARTSRFTTDDVAGAISNAAHAGLDLDGIMNAIPNAMEIALAGGMELSEGLEYLVDITHGAGLSFDELGELVDTWAYAANSSSTTIPEMGEAMQKMGASMQFVKGDMAGLTTMLAVLADNGTKGTQAGTLLRNSLIRLIAPTKKAAETMEGLTLTEEELDEIYADTNGNAEEAANTLKELGFSAYDQEGNLKSFIDIFSELAMATEGMSEQERNSILGAIFPTRTLSGALALLEAAKNGWNGLYESIQQFSDGYGEYAMETMESGLGGTLRRLEAVWQTLQTRTGGALSEDVGNVAEWLTTIVNKVNDLDEGSFAALVGGLEAVAAAGPALITAGIGIKAIGMIAGTGPVGAMVMAGIGIAALANGMRQLEDVTYSDKFGDLTGDLDTLNTYVSGIGTAFSESFESVNQYNTAMQQAITDYTTAASTFKDGAITTMLAGGEMTEEQIASFTKLGTQVGDALLAGIDASYSAAEESVAMVAGENPEDLINGNGYWARVMGLLNAGYEAAISKAQEMSANLRDAMTSAFADGVLSNEEVQNIQSIMDEMNRLLAMQTDARNAAEREKLLRQSQTLGLNGMEQINSMVDNAESSASESVYDAYWQAYYQMKYGGEASGMDEAELQAMLDGLWGGNTPDDLTDGYEGMLLRNKAQYDQLRLDAFDQAASGSELSNVFDGINTAVGEYLRNGYVSFDTLQDSFYGVEAKDIARAMRFINDEIEYMGGMDEVLKRAEYYNQMGDSEKANRLLQLATMGNLGSYIQNDFLPVRGNADELEYDAQGGMNAFDPTRQQFGQRNTYYPTTVSSVGEAQTSGGTSIFSGQSILAKINADTSEAQGEIQSLSGESVTVGVNADTSGAASKIEALGNKTIPVNVRVNVQGASALKGAKALSGFAEGGRATEASIFGEAGAEWAIPEEHSERTAKLLSEAAQASGFTWDELLSRNGGLNSGNGSSQTLVYSPTIYASDATDVESKLGADKERLDRWYREMKLRDRVEAYA